MRRKFILISTILLLGVCINMFGQTKTSGKVKDIVGDRFYSQLIRDGKIVITHEDQFVNLELIPKSQYASKLKSNLIQKQPKHFYYTYEALYYLPKTITVQRASEIARSISKMVTIDYYSNTRRKVTQLYKKAYMIENEKSSAAISDSNYGNCDGKTYYCLMDDASFGETRYRLDYSQSESELLTVFTNTDDMGLGLIRAIMPQDLVINLLIQECDDGMVVYLCADLDSKKMPGVRGKITESMTARMDAISGWFVEMM
ncbi:MAG: hypothetical protein IKX70_07355 [Treponema sp.]|nr:hypothetical protein [Treponema sp.]MBR5033467.1 hypothetical protein [Treponema sp.]